MNFASYISKRIPFFYGWIVLGSAGSSMVVRNAASSLILAIFMYPMSEDLGWSRTLLVGAASFGALASSLVAPFIGWCVDRFGARPVLTICVLLLGLSTFLTGWATVPLVFYITFGFARILFNSPIQLTSTVVVSRWFITNKSKINISLTSLRSPTVQYRAGQGRAGPGIAQPRPWPWLAWGGVKSVFTS